MKHLLLILVLIIPLGVWAQEPSDSSNGTPEINVQTWKLNLQTLHYRLDTLPQQMDTSLLGFQKFHPGFNKQNVHYQDMGLVGSPFQSVVFSADSTLDFNLGMRAHQPWLFHESYNGYTSTGPFTRLNYRQGLKELIYLDVLHTQNIRPNWNFFVDYRRVKTQNLYYNNLTSLADVRLSSVYDLRIGSRYYTPFQKYEVQFEAGWSKNDKQSHGGVASTSLFDSLSGRNKEVNNAVRMPDATDSAKYMYVKVRQYLRPGKVQEHIKMHPTDSTYDTAYSFKPHIQFWHEIKFEREKYVFKSLTTNLNLTPNRYFVAEGNHDSLSRNALYNQVGGSVFGNNFFLEFSAGLEQNQIKYLFDEQVVFNQIPLRAYGHFKWSDRLLLKANAAYVFGGYQNANYLLNGALYFKPIQNIQLFWQEQLMQKSADYYATYNLSNHFIWLNNFNLQNIIKHQVGASLTAGKSVVKLSGKWQNIKDWVYYSTDALPQQKTDWASIVAVTGEWIPRFGFLSLPGQVVWQSTNAVEIPVPEWTVNQSVVGDFYLFEKNFHGQLGVDFFYYQAYYTNYYHPVTRQFILNGSSQTSPLPRFDVYVNGQIKTVRFFVKWVHFNEGWMGDNYYSGYRYPAISRGIRIGLNWDLSN